MSLWSDGSEDTPTAAATQKGAQRSEPGRRGSTNARPLGLIALLAVVVVVAVGGFLALVAAGPEATQALTGVGGVPSGAPYKIGQAAPTSGLQVTVYGAKDPFRSLDPAIQPSPGGHYVVVDVQVTNRRTSRFLFSSLIGFHLLSSEGHQIEATILPGLQPPPPDGLIARGQRVRGLVIFEVRDGMTGLRFRAQGKATSAGAVFSLR